MFSLFKKRVARAVDFSGLRTDMHSHLLPGIDDGAPDVTTSLTLKKGLEDLGYQYFITTPHIMGDMYKNTPATIGAALQQVHQEPGKKNIRAAAEYLIDESFDGLVAGKEPLLTVAGNKVLVEFSFVSPPLDLKENLFNLQIKGYQPIIAHPERYAYLVNNKKIYDEFKSIGCLLQVNMLSFTGYYGKAQQELAQYLLSKKYIDLLGTDLHHDRHLHALRNSSSLMPIVQQLLDSGRLLNPSLEQ
jgi:tyrosine-protein phosphatase YwqE